MIKGFLYWALWSWGLFPVGGGDLPLTEVKEFGPNPGKLKLYQYVPARESLAGEPYPLVVVLHGCNMGAKSMAKASGWNELANQYGFAVLYPEQTVFNNGSSCFNWFQEKDQDGERGETASILAMVQHFRQTHPVDSTRIFIYGVSAGAAIATSVLAQAPCVFASGALLAGGPYKAATSATQALKAMRNPHDRSPKEWAGLLPAMPCKPRLIVVHGTQDHVVDPRSSTELIDQWTGLHHLPPQPDTVLEGYQGNPLVQLSGYRRNGEWLIRYYAVAETGHALPIDPGAGPMQGGHTGIFAVDRDFHSTYVIARDWGLIQP